MFQPLRFLRPGFVILAVGLAPAWPSPAGPAASSEGTSADDEFALVAEQTVTAASKRVQFLSEAPSSVTVITSEEIERFGYRSLGDLLESVRGFYITNDHNYSYVGVRGFARPGDYNTRVLFLLNGHPVNENVYDSTTITGPDAGFDMQTIDRVEIVRGPGSALYGTNAFFAVINVVTRSGARTDGYRTTTRGGSLGQYGAAVEYGAKLESGTDFRVSGTFARSGGEDLYFSEFDTPADNFGVASGLDGERTHQGTFQFARKGWFVQGGHSSRRKEIPTASFGTEFGNPAYYTRDTASFLDIRYDRRLSRDVEMTSRVSYDQYDYSGVYPFAGTPDVMNLDIASGQWAAEESLLSWQTSPSHRLTVGQAFETTVNAILRNYDESPRFDYVDSDSSFSLWSAFLHDEWKPTRGFTLSFGGRLDHYSTLGTTGAPRIAAFFHAPSGSTLKILAGSAFRAPNVFERFYADGVTLEQAADLQPEKVTSYEIIYEAKLPAAISLSFSAFRNDVRNLITPILQPSGLQRFENVEEAMTRGVEAEGRLAAPSGFLAYGSAAYTSGEEGDGVWLTNSPRLALKSGLSVPVIARTVFLSTEFRHLGPRRTLAGDATPSTSTTDLTLLWLQERRATTLSATLVNVFDNDNFAPGSLEHAQDQLIQPGRAFIMRFTARF